MSDETKAPLFDRLSAINVSEHTEKKQKLTYLSWAHAWRYFKMESPDATYKIFRQNGDGLPYNYDERAGYMCHTEVTAEGQTLEMWLPVMDGANNAMKAEKYSYEVQEWVNGQRTGKMIDKWVNPATMFDVNKTLMRCLVKNLGMFGLGINIYAGEDLPIVDTPPPPPPMSQAEAIEILGQGIDLKAMTADYKRLSAELQANADIIAYCKERQAEFKGAAK